MKVFFIFFSLVFGSLFVIGCQQQGTSSAKIQGSSQADQMLNEYEAILDKFEVRLRDSSSPEFQANLGEFMTQAHAWSQKWNQFSGQINPKDLSRLQVRFSQLNKRMIELYRK